MMIRAKKRTIDFTQGPLVGKMLTMFFPLFLNNLLQSFYHAADVMVVGLSGDPEAVGAVGLIGPIGNLFINLFIGIAIGSNVLVGRLLGAKEEEKLSAAIHTSILFSIVMGGVISVVGVLVSRPLLILMGAKGHLLDLAVIYARIYFAGKIFFSVQNYAAAILRAMGDTQTTLYANSVCGILNVLLNLFFVLVCGMTVEGVALATTVSSACSAGWMIRKLMQAEGPCRFSFRKMRIEKHALSQILLVGVPSGLQHSIFSFCNIFVTSSILQVNNMLVGENSLFQPVVKGNTAASTYDGFVYTGMAAMTATVVSVASQNVGAKDYQRVKRSAWVGSLLSVVVGVVLALSFYLLKGPLLGFYQIFPGGVGTPEQLAYDTALCRMHLLMLPYFSCGVMNVLAGVAKTIGKPIASTVISLIGVGALRLVILLVIFPLVPRLEVIYLSFPVTWVGTGIAQGICVFWVLRRFLREQKNKITPQTV